MSTSDHPNRIRITQRFENTGSLLMEIHQVHQHGDVMTSHTLWRIHLYEDELRDVAVQLLAERYHLDEDDVTNAVMKALATVKDRDHDQFIHDLLTKNGRVVHPIDRLLEGMPEIPEWFWTEEVDA